MKKIIIIFCLFFFIVTSSFAEANRKFSLFVGAGELLNIYSYRVGISSWEFGRFNNGVAAIAKNFYAGNTYVSFGPAYTYGNGIGVYGAVGMDFPFLHLFYLKTELNAASTFNNYNVGTGIIGLGVFW